MHQRQVTPTVELAAYLGHPRDHREAEPFMKCDLLFVRRDDSCHYHVDSGRPGSVDQGFEEPAAKAATPIVLLHVNRVLNRVINRRPS